MPNSYKKPIKNNAVKTTVAPEQQPYPDNSLSKWMDNYQIMEEFKITQRTLYNWRRKKYIPHTKIGNKSYYNRTEIEAMMRKNTIMPDSK